MALGAKSARPRIPLWLLIVAAFSLDLVEVGFKVVEAYEAHMAWASSVATAVVLAALLGGIYGAVQRDRKGALLVGLVAFSHAAADFVTDAVFLWPGSNKWGWHLYNYKYADLAVESLVVIVGWLAYRRSLGRRARSSPAVWLVLLIPIGAQLLFSFGPSIAQMSSWIAATVRF